MSSSPIKVFFSYSHEDEEFRDQLEKHLTILTRQGVISTWHDRKIGAGREWAGEISDKLDSAQIVLLLISSSFLASEYCYDIELRRALERHESGDAVVIPIIIRPVYWEGAPFGKLQALPTDARPVTKWRSRDEAFEEIARGISTAAKNLATHDRAPIVPPPAADQPVTTPPSADAKLVLSNMKFVLIQPGEFLMGDNSAEENERPAHPAVVKRPFYMGACVVTQGEWRVVMGSEPWKGGQFFKSGDYYPAVYISWADAKTFIARANSLDPENYYRLPTEAEWEYAARAGTSTKFSFGDEARLLNAYGWYSENAWDAGHEYPHQVGEKRPNGWGLYDIHGNVWEWVEDWYHGSYSAEEKPEADEKVLRGGGFDFSANGARSAFRNKLLPIRSNHVIGFRLVKDAL